MKTFTRVAVVILALAALAIGINTCGPKPPRAREFTIVTSFYPMYIMAKNIARDIPGVRVVNLTPNNTGCLHDYQLTPDDMRTLAAADVLIMNSTKTEPLLNLDRMRSQNPRLVIIIAGFHARAFDEWDTFSAFQTRLRTYATPQAGIPLETNPYTRPLEHVDPYHFALSDTPLIRPNINTDYPADGHQWVSPAGAREQVTAIAQGLVATDPVHAEQYLRNAAAYDVKLAFLSHLFMHALPVSARPAIITHNAFNWLLWGGGEIRGSFRIFGILESENDHEPTPDQLVESVGLARQNQVVIISTSTPPSRAAQTLARETGAHIYPFDLCVSGPDDYDAYLKAMERNLEVLKEALR